MDMYSTLVPLLLEDELAEMRGFFQAYLPEDREAPQVLTNYLEKAKAFSMDLEHLELTPMEEEQGEEEDDDGVPQWLKEARGEQPEPPLPSEEEKPEEAPEEEPEQTPFFTSDGLKLELTPMDEESTDEEEESSRDS